MKIKPIETWTVYVSPQTIKTWINEEHDDLTITLSGNIPQQEKWQTWCRDTWLESREKNFKVSVPTHSFLDSEKDSVQGDTVSSVREGRSDLQKLGRYAFRQATINLDIQQSWRCGKVDKHFFGERWDLTMFIFVSKNKNPKNWQGIDPSSAPFYLHILKDILWIVSMCKIDLVSCFFKFNKGRAISNTGRVW